MDLIYKYYYKINGNRIPAHLPEVRVDEEVMKKVTQIFMGKEEKINKQ